MTGAAAVNVSGFRRLATIAGFAGSNGWSDPNVHVPSDGGTSSSSGRLVIAPPNFQVCVPHPPVLIEKSSRISRAYCSTYRLLLVPHVRLGNWNTCVSGLVRSAGYS